MCQYANVRIDRILPDSQIGTLAYYFIGTLFIMRRQYEEESRTDSKLRLHMHGTAHLRH